MTNRVYSINKGINRSIEFKGLKAQYIWYMGVGMLTLVIAFVILYICGLDTVICLVLVLSAGVTLVIKVYALSHRYGEFGLMKRLARKRVPRVIRNYSRDVFLRTSN